MSKIAVFDLDRTLLAGDSTESWIRELVYSSPLRFALGLMSAPVGLVLMRFPEQRKIGASIFIWIVTVGVSERKRVESLDRFNRRFQTGLTKCYWHVDGIKQLEQHIEQGHRVVVVTAAPEVLAKKMLMPWLDDITVIGTSIRPFLGGWVGQRLCRHVEKCNFLNERGFGLNWDFAYSDSDDDAPILIAAKNAYLINASEKIYARVQKYKPQSLAKLTWT